MKIYIGRRTDVLKKYPIIFACILLLLDTSDLKGQNLAESRRTSSHTYLYQLSDKEAVTIYKKGLGEVDETFFHTLVHSYPTDSTLKLQPNPGHYLSTWANQEKLNFELISVSNVSVKIMNNGADMNLILHDLIGQEINDAMVTIDGKTMRYHQETQSYLLKKTNKKGVLMVEYEGIKSFTFLEREINNPTFRRLSRSVLYSVPLKYLWIPISTVLHSPVDLFNSVRRGRPQGVFYHIVKPFKDVVYSIKWGDPQGFVQKVFCVFDRYHCDGKKYDGYMVMNKPKYRPGDSVKFKAFITNEKGKPIDKELEMWLTQPYNSGTKKLLGKIRPYRKGAYAYSFFLHDSLRLPLDARYNISFKDKHGDRYIDADFSYEEYELKSNQYTFRADKKSHFHGQGLNLYADGTDINGLNLFDVQLELTVLSTSTQAIFDDQVIVEDTLLQYRHKLENIGETKISIPDSIFPKANIDYQVIASFTNAENEKKHKDQHLTYNYRKDEIVYDAVNDSLSIAFHKNGVNTPKRVLLTVYNDAADIMEEKRVDLPVKLKINPFAFEYDIKVDALEGRWQVGMVPAQLECLTSRTADSLHIWINNPRKLLFRYFIYEQNKEILKGSGMQLNAALKNRINGKYFISLHFIWGGKVKSENYEISYQEKKLNIQVFEPGTVFPGQETEIKVLVKDAQGNAVANADLTAFAFTKKFEAAEIPEVPYFGKNYKDRILINSFVDKGNSLEEQTEHKLLDWQVWNTRMKLDTIEYFKFLFPRYNYATTLPVEDSITQFAPYLVERGEINPIHIIYLDNRPVYFSVSSTSQRYAFPVMPGYHQLRLRTRAHEVTIDSVFFEPKVKNIFSFLLDTVNHNIKVVKKPMKLTDYEYNMISGHLISVDNNFSHATPIYLKQNNRLFWVNEKGDYRRTRLLGPVFSDKATLITAGRDTTSFHLEQRYNYSFQSNLIKMKFNEYLDFSKYLYSSQSVQPLGDRLLTENEIKQSYNLLRSKNQASWKGFINPDATNEGRGRIEMRHNTLSKVRFIKNLILLKDNEPQFFRIYAGNHDKVLHDLAPATYTVFLLLDDNSYLKRIGIEVKKHATTLIKTEADSLYPADEISMLIDEKVRQMQESNGYSIGEEGFRAINKAIIIENRINRYSGETIFGVVISKEDGLPLPGVNVIIKGTSIGTITDLNGEYMIKVPENYNMLSVSFIGYVTEEVSIGTTRELNVSLGADINQLSEVVVVGYGTQKKRNFTSSITAIESKLSFSNTLQGRVAGVSLEAGAPGSIDKISIRGVSSVSSSSDPLYVVNGVPYSGKDLDISSYQIKSVEVLSSDAAMAVFGSRAINGAVLITLKEGADLLKTVMSNNTFIAAMEASSAIRNNFSDYAYWEPGLSTDEEGLAKLKVKFPDDITAWKTNILGMTGNKQSGQYHGEIKAFKTVAGTLSTPTFLIEGDTSALIGKALNYTSDTLNIGMQFQVDSMITYTGTYKLLTAKIDTLQVAAPAADTITFQYKISKSDGYFDGELRKIPVFRKGVEEITGDFFVLEKDSNFNYPLPYPDQPFQVSITSNILQVLIDEAEHIKKYEHLCNEQMASKIKALVALKRIKKFQKEEFRYEKLLKRLLNNLQKNQKEQLWGWWPKSDINYWTSFHVLEALLEAEKEGIRLVFDKQAVIEKLIFNIDSKPPTDQLKILKILHLLGAPYDYKPQLDSLEKRDLSFAMYLEILLIKQELKLPYTLDTLFKYQKETMFGGLYWEESANRVYNNTIVSTLNAYELLKNSGNHEAQLPKIRQYFFESRKSTGYWRNTYESANILESILPDILVQGESYSTPKISINQQGIAGAFPFDTIYAPASHVAISKSGTGPVFFSVFQRHWNDAPVVVANDFVISTAFKNDKKVFNAGKEVTMEIVLALKKDAEYVMVEVPIPAGFSYVSKETQPGEDHREYFKNKVNIYFTTLAAGEYKFIIDLLPRFSGSYQLNPAKAELMYFPVFFGRNEGKRITVK